MYPSPSLSLSLSLSLYIYIYIKPRNKNISTNAISTYLLISIFSESLIILSYLYQQLFCGETPDLFQSVHMRIWILLFL